MQIHPCIHCKNDSFGGGSIVYGGMFFKLCPECLEDEKVIQQLNECWALFEEQENKESLVDN